MRRAVVWSDQARADYLGIIGYIAAENPPAAERVATRIEGAAEPLGDFATGRRGRVSGTHELVLPRLPYILAYEIQPATDGGERVVILHVIHAARHWPPEQWPAD